MARVFTKDLVRASGSKWGELRLDIVPGTQSITNNTTAITYELYIQRTATNFGGYYSGYTSTATLTINGTAITVSGFTYDFRTNYKKSLKTGSMTITHSADGTKTISTSASVTMQGEVPSGSGSGNLALTTIPRASSFTLSGSTETGSAISVAISRASSSFTHRVRWRIGSGAWTTSATSATTSSSVTVPHTAIPNSPSATVTIAVQTFSGSTTIGNEVSASRTLTVPASVIPSFSAVTATENVSEVSTKVGAFVKGKSKLNLAITGASGAGGSTITGYKITLTGTTINGSSGVSNLVTTSGNVVITGTVTDSRGRTGSKTLTINVLNYTAPTLEGLAFYRSNSAGVADPTGTYVTVKGTVTVSSLIVGTTQKNKVSYDSQHDKTGSFVSFITETPDVITKAYTNILPTFTIDKIFNFRSRAGDIFGYGGWSVGVVPSGEVTQQWGSKTTSFGKMIDNTSYNVQVGTGGIQIDGPIIDKNGADITDRITTLERFFANPRGTTGTSFNDITFAGTYMINKTMINSPVTGNVYGIIQVFTIAGDWVFQDLWLASDNRRFRRVRASSGFTSWQEY